MRASCPACASHIADPEANFPYAARRAPRGIPPSLDRFRRLTIELAAAPPRASYRNGCTFRPAVRRESEARRRVPLLLCYGGTEIVDEKQGRSACGNLGGSKNLGHRGRQFDPGVPFDFELLASAFCQLVEFRAPIVFGNTPASLDPAAPLQAMEGGIERALLDAQHLARNLLDALGYGPAVLRFQRKGLQDEQIQRSLRKVDTVRFGHALPSHFYKEHTRSLVEAQGERRVRAAAPYSRVRAAVAARNRIAQSAIRAQGLVCVR